jgi:hypothetical protein
MLKDTGGGKGFKYPYNRLATCLQLPCNHGGTMAALWRTHGVATAMKRQLWLESMSPLWYKCVP